MKPIALVVGLLTPTSCTYATMPILHRSGRRRNDVVVRMGTWVEGGTSSTVVNVPAPFAFNIISDYRRWPEWSPWLSRVESFEPDEDGATSRWHLKFRAVDVNWNSKRVELIPDSLLRWESTSGIRNSGSLESMPITDNPSSCTVTVSLRYEIPTLLEKLLSTRFVANLVGRRLKADLGRFRALAEREHGDGGGDSRAPGPMMCESFSDDNSHEMDSAPKKPSGFLLWLILVWAGVPAALQVSGLQIPERLHIG